MSLRKRKGEAQGYLGVAQRPFSLDYPQPTPLRPMKPQREAAAMQSRKPKREVTEPQEPFFGGKTATTAKSLVHRATAHARRPEITDNKTFYDTAQQWLDDHQHRYQGKHPAEVYSKAKEMIDLLRVLAEL